MGPVRPTSNPSRGSAAEGAYHQYSVVEAAAGVVEAYRQHLVLEAVGVAARLKLVRGVVGEHLRMEGGVVVGRSMRVMGVDAVLLGPELAE